MKDVELFRDSFQNFKTYQIPKAQLIIADVPYNLGKNAYASNPSWYKDGDNKNGESELAGKKFFNSENEFRPAEFMHFCSDMLMKEPKKQGCSPCMILFCEYEQQFMFIELARKYGLMKYIPLVFRKNFSAQVLKANMKVVGNCEYGLLLYREKLPKFNNDGADGKGLFGITLSQNAGGVFIVTPEAADRFCLEGDERNDIIMKGAINYYDISTHTMGTEPYIYNGQQVVLTKNITILNDQMDLGNDLNAWCQGYRCIKWAIQADDYNLYNRNQSNDVPIFRYADILLMKAEAILRGATATNGDTPQSLFNQIRSYCNAPLLEHSPSLDELLEERAREFYAETWRRNDLIRFGKFEDDWGYKNQYHPEAKTEKWRRIFPVSVGLMNSNTNWKQNYGYW